MNRLGDGLHNEANIEKKVRDCKLNIYATRKLETGKSLKTLCSATFSFKELLTMCEVGVCIIIFLNKKSS